MEKSRTIRGQRQIDKAVGDMDGRRGLGKVIVYRQVKPHAARRRKSITVDCASPATEGWIGESGVFATARALSNCRSHG
jgi:hypothetical protein